jgi:hypothetical protein
MVLSTFDPQLGYSDDTERALVNFRLGLLNKLSAVVRYFLRLPLLIDQDGHIFRENKLLLRKGDLLRGLGPLTQNVAIDMLLKLT